MPNQHAPAAREFAVFLSRRAAVEALGTGFLLAAVVGSGIMAEQLAGGNVALALVANTMATAAALVALISAFGTVSGAHFNPAVTVASALQGALAWRDVPAYIFGQCVGAFAGVACAHAMFAQAIVTASQHARSGGAQVFSEFIATFGLVAIIGACSRASAPGSTPIALSVSAYIAAAYWFTASTSFANPAATLARSATATFSGIRVVDVSAFVVAQLLGATVAARIMPWLLTPTTNHAAPNSSPMASEVSNASPSIESTPS